LSITSPRHATALTLYAVLAVLGLFHVSGVAGHVAVTAKLGDGGASLWAALYFVGPLLALGCAVLSKWIRVPVLPLWGEGFGCILVSVTTTTWVWAVVDHFGFDRAASTVVIFGGIALGMVLRFAQITHEQGRIKKARANPRPADPPPLAEADARG
jgi:hypothetical protein